MTIAEELIEAEPMTQIEEDGFHQNWYPVALLSELQAPIVGKDFLGTRVMAYRNPAGKLVVQEAWCPHLGADLSMGELVDGNVECPYHHWQFNCEGQCKHIPTTERIPSRAKIRTYPVAEAWGILWAFNGEKPLFPPPRMPGVDEVDVLYHTLVAPMPLPTEPWIWTSNGVDFQHLKALHALNRSEPDNIQVNEYGIEWKVQRPADLRHGVITGTNTFSEHAIEDGRDWFVLFTGTPLRKGQNLAYFVIGIPNPHPESVEEQQALQAKLKEFATFAARLRSEDGKVFRSMRFRPKALVAADRYLAKYFRYVKQFPKTKTFAEW